MASVTIGPGPLTTPGIDGGLPFVLWRMEWLQIQLGVASNTLLPTALPQLRTIIGPGAPSDMSDFQRLVDANAAIAAHGFSWQSDLLLAIASLGSDVYEFGSDIAPIFYPPVLTEAQTLGKNPNDAGSKAALKQILLSLQQTVAGYQANAATVAAQFEQYAQDNDADLAGYSSVSAYYTDNYGDNSPHVTALVASLQAAREAVKADVVEAAEDYIIAETSTICTLFFPIGSLVTMGMIAAYMTKAEEAEAQAVKDQKEADTLNAELQAAYKLMAALGLGVTGLNTIASAAVAAAPSLSAVASYWGDLGDTFGRLAGLTDTDLADCLHMIATLGFDTAVTDWQAAADSANKFRTNVYMKTAAKAA